MRFAERNHLQESEGQEVAQYLDGLNLILRIELRFRFCKI